MRVPRQLEKASGRLGDRPEAEESSRQRSSALLPQGLHLQGDDVLVSFQNIMKIKFKNKLLHPFPYYILLKNCVY